MKVICFKGGKKVANVTRTHKQFSEKNEITNENDC
jgi:hypothetical protein